MQKHPPSSIDHQADFPIVGLGASAGGLAAFIDFVEGLPDSPGMAYVIVQHLDPTHESHLTELLQRHTQLEVREVVDQPEVLPDSIYVIPPGKSLTISEGRLTLSEPEQPRGRRAPIDRFFRSLAEDQGENAACVILSGTGSDGTLGLRSITHRGGISLVQHPDEAEYDGMPRSAVQTGLVDVVAPARELGARLARVFERREQVRELAEAEALPPSDSLAFKEILALVQSRTGHDFASYKSTTVRRRMARRLQFHDVDDLSTYRGFLHDHPEEVEALFKDFLIGVTNFFRDDEVFEAFERQIIPELAERAQQNQPIRAWVCGCSTGEEAYSLAILLAEMRQRLGRRVDIQIFATDIDEDAIARAREGRFPSAIEADLTPSRLQRYFQPIAGGYRVNKELRDMVLFTTHDVLTDPPFSHLDVLSCRNLLIYLQRPVQERVFEIFNYALEEDGVLMLGKSETAMGDLFERADPNHRIFRNKATPAGGRTVPPLYLQREAEAGVSAATHKRRGQERHAAQHERLMLERFARPSLLVDSRYRILHVGGGAGELLPTFDGPPTDNLLERVDEGLRVQLRTALFQAFRKRNVIEGRRVDARVGGERRTISLSVYPVEGSDLAHIVLTPLSDGAGDEGEPVVDADGESDGEARGDAAVVEQLEEELNYTREQLQTTHEEFETTTEELRASNEELRSTNEELRSTSEELETSREELQSTNEELVTVNQELKTKIRELSRANGDLQNLMESTEIGTLFLSADLALKRYTPPVLELFHIISSDIGRPLAHLTHRLDYEDLVEDCREVLGDNAAVERELRSDTGEWYLVKIAPYRTLEGEIDGVVLSFVDITKRKQAEEDLRDRARQHEVVASLGLEALRTSSIDELLDLATRRVADALDAPICAVFSCEEGDEPVYLAGHGMGEAVPGELRLEGEGPTLVSCALAEDAPVVIESLDDDPRVVGHGAFTERGVVGAMTVLIHGDDAASGVLTVMTRQRRVFTENDVHFAQSVANLLGDSLLFEQTRAELAARQEALEMTEEQFRQAIVESPFPMLIFARDGAMVHVSRAVEESLGYGVDDLPTVEAWLEKVHVDRLDRGREVFDEAFDLEGRVHFGDFQLRTSDGEHRIWSLSAAALGDDAHHGALAVMSAFDVTGPRKLAAQLKEARDEAEAASAAKSAFMANISHDIRTPLNTVLGFTHLLSQEQLTRDGDEYAQIIRESIHHLKGTLDSILEFVRMEHGTSPPLEPGPLEAGEATRQLLRMYELAAAEKGIALHLELDDRHGTWMEVDEIAFGRIMTNLIGNALKFTEEGAVTVRVRRERDHGLIEVVDTGVGIEPDFLPHVFEMFEQQSSGDQRQYEGSGLGLAIAYNLVEAMGGDIEVESTPGEGTTFTVTLPLLGAEQVEALRRQATQSAEVERDRANRRAQVAEDDRPTVLVVEDDERTRRMFDRALHRRYKVVLAASVDEALEAAARISADAALLDINLGEQRTGVDLLQSLRDDVDGYDAVPIIACTAHAGPSDRNRFLDEGFDYYLEKPFEPAELYAMLDDALERSPAATP